MGCVLFDLSPDTPRDNLDHMRKPQPRTADETRLKTAEVASILGISQRTLMRKLAAGIVEEPARDIANNYRLWRPEEVHAAQEQLQRGKA